MANILTAALQTELVGYTLALGLKGPSRNPGEAERMPLVLIVLAFVTAAMYLRRHFGGSALAALWAVTTSVMALTNSALFLETVKRAGTSASSAGRGLTMAFMLFLMATSFGSSAFMIHRGDTGDGPWLTARGFVFGVVGFVAGGAVAYAVVALTIVLVVSQMAP
jgi:hypothetical protein